MQSWTGVGNHDPARVQALWLSALGVDPQLYDNDVGHAARDPLAGTCSHKPSQYQRRTGTDQESIEFGCVKSRVYRLTSWVWRTFYSELSAVVSFIPCFYFLFLTVVAAVIIGLFNISRSERVHQDPSPGVERNVTATKRVPRLFMVVPKTKHGSPAKKAANSAAVPTEKADAKKNKHHKSRAGLNGGY